MVDWAKVKVEPGGRFKIETVHGNLTVRTWAKNEVEARSDSDHLELTESEGSAVLTCLTDAVLQVPPSISLEIGDVHGDVSIRDVKGPMTARTIAAGLAARHCGPISVGQIGAEADIRHAVGNLDLADVGGSVRVRHAVGDLHTIAGGNLSARMVRGRVQADVGGNADIAMDEMSSGGVDVRAGGNARIRLGEGSGAQVHLASGAGAVHVDGVTRQVGPGQTLEAQLGTGGPVVRVSAGGTILLSRGRGTNTDTHESLGEGFSEMAEEFAAQIELRMDGLGHHIEAQLAEVADRLPWVLDRAGLSGDEADRIARDVRSAGERALRRAERRAARAIRLAERRTARDAAARRRDTPAATAPTKEPVSPEEREVVLRLLGAGRLSAREADELLAALEEART
jgi:hypothetical protein